MKNQKLFFIKLGLVFASLLSGAGVVHAEEVPVGYVLSKANLSAAENQTFEGHNLAAMITPGMKALLDNNLKITLRPYKKVVYGTKNLATTAKYSGGVKLDRATRTLSGFVAGTPFPNVSESDPDLAIKMVWNAFYNNIQLADIVMASTTAYSIDAVKGIERSFGLVNYQLKLKHRTVLTPDTIGDGDIYRKILIFNLFPQDVAGTGAYIQRYDDGRVDDSWAYIKSIRRIRRMSGGTWMDPIPGTTLLNDDSGGLDSFPTWYKDYKFIKKQRILAVVHAYVEGPNRSGDSMFDRNNPPYWNPIQVWEPREVYVIDAIPPDAHPYSRKRLYFDIEGNTPLFLEMYDKKGTFWKIMQLPLTDVVQPDGREVSMAGSYVFGVDFQRMQGSYLPVPFNRHNEPNADLTDWAPEGLSKPEKYTIPSLLKRYGPATFVPN